MGNKSLKTWGNTIVSQADRTNIRVEMMHGLIYFIHIRFCFLKVPKPLQTEWMQDINIQIIEFNLRDFVI